MKTASKLVLVLSLMASTSALADHYPAPYRPAPRPVVVFHPAMPETRVLGSTSLSFSADRDLIIVRDSCPSRFAFPVRALMLEVNGADARIDFVRVRFDNGMSDELPVHETLLAGTRTRMIDLRGAAHCIDTISVMGETLGRSHGFRSEARVSFIGVR